MSPTPLLNVKPKAACRFDQISLGEIMLRLDPGDMRIRTARSFRAWEGGGEYNVARGLRRCFGLRTAVATAFADNEIEVWRALTVVVDSGELRPGHMRARKPDN